MDNFDLPQFEERKRAHLEYALDPAHQAEGFSELDSLSLYHEALPDLDFEEVELKTPLPGAMTVRPVGVRETATPFFIAGMTAGHADAQPLNERLAEACERRGWILGLGSQRRELQARGNRADDWASLRKKAPNAVILANLGITQLRDAPIEAIRGIAEGVRASALVIHLNALQESLQLEGTPQFRGAFERLREISEKAPLPVIVKETGCGMSPATLKKLAALDLAAVDVSGLGGTHWGRIEGKRAEKTDSLQNQAALTFANWGESTVTSVEQAARLLPESTEIWASGGVRNGLHAAKLIALGATRVGFAQPALIAAQAGEKALDEWMAARELELRIALFCTSCTSPGKLREEEKRHRGSKLKRVSGREA